MTFQSFENYQIGINRVENLELYQFFNVNLKFTLKYSLILVSKRRALRMTKSESTWSIFSCNKFDIEFIHEIKQWVAFQSYQNEKSDEKNKGQNGI